MSRSAETIAPGSLVVGDDVFIALRGGDGAIRGTVVSVGPDRIGVRLGADTPWRGGPLVETVHRRTIARCRRFR